MFHNHTEYVEIYIIRDAGMGVALGDGAGDGACYWEASKIQLVSPESGR